MHAVENPHRIVLQTVGQSLNLRGDHLGNGALGWAGWASGLNCRFACFCDSKLELVITVGAGRVKL